MFFHIHIIYYKNKRNKETVHLIMTSNKENTRGLRVVHLPGNYF